MILNLLQNYQDFKFLKDRNANVQEEKWLSNDVQIENGAVKPVG